ncbi:hypothetical protein ASA1KI_42980 [Opitutales bacterium ASA1]|nr:hypothetical protein ASA1KI_42980 [Opitutales bacterium ASA1]
MSRVLKQATKRSASIASIDVELDLGNGLTLASFQAAVGETRQKLDAYNTLLARAAEARDGLASAEANLGDLHERMLAGIAARFGRDSVQYVMAGGTRKSEAIRKRVATRLTSGATPTVPDTATVAATTSGV